MKRVLLAVAAMCLSLNIWAEERALELQTPMGTVYGTLLTPDSPTTTAAIIIAGSGPTDRNGNTPLGISTDCYKMIAEGLMENGIASLRYDKRGIAQSASPLATNSTLRFDHYIDDVRSWAAMLRQQGYDRIVLIGHSEGAQLALEAARNNPDVQGVISVAGAGSSADILLLRQLGAQLPMDLYMKASTIIATLKAGQTVDQYPEELVSLFHESIQPYMISWFRSDPARCIAQLTQPVMIIQGTTDVQISVDDAKALKSACPKAELVIVENMNHVLKQCVSTDMQEQMRSSYIDPKLPLHNELMSAMVRFINAI